MRWPGGAFWIAVAFAAGVGNYAVKQMVQGLDDNLTNVRKKIVAEQKQIHDLTAEWTYLNQPELLADLNRRYLGLQPITPRQEHGGVDDIAIRPLPALDAVPEVQVATVALLPQLPAEPVTKMAAAIVPVSAPAPVTVSAPSRTPVAAAAAADKPKPASLDALFERVAGSR